LNTFLTYCPLCVENIIWFVGSRCSNWRICGKRSQKGAWTDQSKTYWLSNYFIYIRQVRSTNEYWKSSG
jgi:hypothetical protein